MNQIQLIIIISLYVISSGHTMLPCEQGESACEGLKIDILLPTWDRFLFNKIMCNSNNACEGLDITVRNEGCNNVIIQNLDCTHSNSCNNGIFNLIGDVSIENGNCGSSCSNKQGLESCVR
eukprot:416704_1